MACFKPKRAELSKLIIFKLLGINLGDSGCGNMYDVTKV